MEGIEKGQLWRRRRRVNHRRAVHCVQRKSLAGQWKQREAEGEEGEGVKVIHGDACPGILIAALTLIGLHDAL